nr:unnamed protein product [Callosobruchus analis]
MSTNPQWKSFQPPPDNINQDASIMEFKSLTSNGKTPSQQQHFSAVAAVAAYNNSRSFPALNEKSASQGLYSGVQSQPPNGLYGSSSATHTSTRFPPVGTFAVDANNAYNSGGDGGQMFSCSNGNGASYDSSNSANLGTRETGIIEKLLVSHYSNNCYMKV